jgi:hypothetical protein
MDEFIRVELKKVFPNNKLVEIPSDHPIFNQKFKFNGLPKIHEHDNKRPQAFGIIEKGSFRKSRKNFQSRRIRNYQGRIDNFLG